MSEKQTRSAIGKGEPGPGRRKGIPNRTTTALKQAILDAYDHIGGDAAFAKWARANPGDFYPLLAKMLPRELLVDGELGLHVVRVKDLTGTKRDE